MSSRHRTNHTCCPWTCAGVFWLLWATCNLQATSVHALVPDGFNKAQLCAKDMESSAKALELIQVTPSRAPWSPRSSAPKYPRIFCFVNTIESWHKTRAQAVADTWGQRCDKLVFFSNVSTTLAPTNLQQLETNQKFDVVFINVPPDHNHLWQKHKATLRYVYEYYRHDYDWFYKCDDDAYVIVENLREYLKRPEILMKYQVEPMQMGHRFNLTRELVDYYVVDQQLEDEFHRTFDRWVFNSGGPGYVMNRLYLDKLMPLLPDIKCLSDDMSEMLPDDSSISFCMMWYGIFPVDTRDVYGRERWHPDKPSGVYYSKSDDPDYWYVQYHRQIGEVLTGDKCCSPDSIAFHYVKPNLMYHLERQLYFCRDDQSKDIDEFNRRFDLEISDQVLVYPKDAKESDFED